MCDNCKKIFEDVPENIRNALEEHREEVLALMLKLGDKVGEAMVTSVTREDIPQSEKEQANKELEEIKAMSGFAALVGYVSMLHINHPHYQEAFDTMYQSGSDIGFYKRKADDLARTLN